MRYVIKIQIFTYALTVGILDYSEASLFDLLNCAIREDTLFFAVWEKTFDCTVREAYLLCSIREMLFDLVVLKLKDLKAVWESSLRGLCLWKEIDYFAAWEGLLDILVLEKDDLVTIGPYFSLHSVRENYLFLAALVELLLLALWADHFVDLLEIFICLIWVVFFWEDKIIFFSLLFFIIFQILVLVLVFVIFIGTHRAYLFFGA